MVVIYLILNVALEYVNGQRLVCGKDVGVMLHDVAFAFVDVV